jgi:hypothetical protein
MGILLSRIEAHLINRLIETIVITGYAMGMITH